ncbi:uncharacterized protein EKO05_0000337 [Ascochyta rabiei]|uniref:uncharacterized protein n=1 Tax=Didymella rabiei TaxID=5454 RepID=UPI00220CFC7E|nr:uncharacterized protein EKO05_0000337 [Ascochyta rabiei]UPX09652.1 hypothetical protein EKO05_0000337 [Ascochyta rabiei]
MDTDCTIPAPLPVEANKLSGALPKAPFAKVEHSSSPPPLIEDTSDILEDGEIHEQQETVSSLRSELQLSTLEYSALNDRFKRLERQHSDMQDLASAYSEVIRGFSPTEIQNVSIDQLQAEAGHDGLRAKALEADVLRPLIREAGGLQALISQMHATKTLIDKAGGLRELEKFVSDLRTIRDTLDELKGSQGLGGLVSEVRALLAHKQQHVELKSRVDGPNGLRTKAARYEKLIQAVTDVQNDTQPWKQNPTASTVSSVRASSSSTQPARSQQSPAGPAAMNPARARLISATPLEADPDRDLYEPVPPVAEPLNKTGSNNTPLGVSQVQPVASSSTLKRKGVENTAPSVWKRARVDLDRASALVQASLSPSTDKQLGRGSAQSNTAAGTAGPKTRAQPSRSEYKETWTEQVWGSQPRARKAVATPRMPDWMRADIQFGKVGFGSVPSTGRPAYPSTAPSLDVESHADTRWRLVRLGKISGGVPPSLSARPETCHEGRTASSVLQNRDLKALKAFFKHPVALWVGSKDGYGTSSWDDYQSYDLKRDAQIPDELLVSLLNELVKYVDMGNISRYEQMAPSCETCILR